MWKIKSPTFTFGHEYETDLFIEFLGGEYGELTLEKKDKLSVNIAEPMFMDDIKELYQEFESYISSFHKEILEREFKQLAIIIGMWHYDTDNLVAKLRQLYDVTFDEGDDYADIHTPFHTLTLCIKDNYRYLSDYVEVYNHLGAIIGHAYNCSVDNDGDFHCDFRED